jgi:AraC family transcriptional activator of pobA
MKHIPVRKIKSGPKEQPVPENFTIRELDKLLAGKDMVQDLHRHDFFLIMVLEKGAGDHEIDFIPYTLCDHSVFLMRPGQVHKHTIKTGSKGYLIQFKPEFYPSSDTQTHPFFRRCFNQNFFQLETHRIQKLLSISRAIFEEEKERQAGYPEIIKANLSIFLIELSRQNDLLNPSKNPQKLYSQEILEEFLARLDSHISEHKQVSEYAQMLNLSTYQLNAITKATLGKTCSDLIKEQMILEAKRYLLATPSQVKEIAYELGFEDISYFIRFFKKQTGLTPEAFRHNFK